MSFELESFQRNGYAILPGVFREEAIDSLRDRWNSLIAADTSNGAILTGGSGGVYGVRNLLSLWPDVINLLDPIHPILVSILGTSVGVVRGLLFDKPPGQSWALPMHRDLTIAIKSHGRIGTFTKPTIKAGVPHVEAPASLLDQMVTVRIHLDDMTDANGPLKLVPGSHRGESSNQPVTIFGHAGDVLLMRPRILHGSGQSDPETTSHRRVIHLECAVNVQLEDGYHWKDFIPLAVSHRSDSPFLATSVE